MGLIPPKLKGLKIMKTYVIKINYPELEFEADSEEQATELAAAAVHSNDELRKYIEIIRVED